MKRLFFFSLLIFSCLIAPAQFVARMQAKEPIPGVCNIKNIIVPFPSFKGQEVAICPVSKKEIQRRLNAEVPFLSLNAKYSGKGMIGLVVNCKGEVVQCKMDNKTGSEELDKQIEAVFNSLGEWKAGKLNGKPVDTSNLFSFTIESGTLTLN
jgi:hypothetical protein